MRRSIFRLSLALLFITWCLPRDGSLRAEPRSSGVGSTTILKWKHGKQAAFLLEFDDSVPTDINIVIPELVRHGMVGTFYINPGNAAFRAYRAKWETEIPKTGMVYANHTCTHVGAKSAAQLDDELGRCSQEIDACFPGLPQPRLVSFGQPGGVPWTVTAEEKKAALAKYHLVERPPYKGYVTKEQLLALVDQALASGGTEYNVFHGVGGDWLVTPTDAFVALLDKLAANRTQLWITDPISWHQYNIERDDAAITVLEIGKDHLRLSLRCTADPAVYNLPVTLATQVPPEWTKCLVVQGKTTITVTAAAGEVRYDAIPGLDEISIQPTTD